MPETNPDMSPENVEDFWRSLGDMPLTPRLRHTAHHFNAALEIDVEYVNFWRLCKQSGETLYGVGEEIFRDGRSGRAAGGSTPVSAKPRRRICPSPSSSTPTTPSTAPWMRTLRPTRTSRSRPAFTPPTPLSSTQMREADPCLELQSCRCRWD